MKKQTIYIVPHIPKTGGSTLVNHLKNLNNEDYKFYHLAPRGRKGYHSNKASFETDSRHKIETKNIIILGHHVDEGIINYFNGSQIILSTVLREPLNRLISHFNMIKGNGNYSDSFVSFIKKRRNFMAKFLIKKFPSFIDNPLDSLSKQANDIINKFDQCYFLEDGDIFFNQFLEPFGINYDSKLTDRRRDPNYKNYTKEEKINTKIIEYFKSDISLYQTQKNIHNKTDRPQLPQIKSVHKWFVYFYTNYIFESEQRSKSNMIDSIPEGFLKSVLNHFDTASNIDIRTLFELGIKHQAELSLKENFINFLDLTSYILKTDQNYTLEDFKTLDRSSLVQNLIHIFQQTHPKKLRQINHDSIIDFKYKNSDLEFAAAKISFAKKEFELSKKSIMNAIELNPLIAENFYLLYRISQAQNEKETSIRAIEKCLELNRNNKKFKESYIDIFKFN